MLFRSAPPQVKKQVAGFDEMERLVAVKAVRYHFDLIARRCASRALALTYEARWSTMTVLEREIVIIRAGEAIKNANGARWRYLVPEITLRSMRDSGAWVSLLRFFLTDLRDTTDYPVLRYEDFERLQGRIQYDEGIPSGRAPRVRTHNLTGRRHAYLAQWVTFCLFLLVNLSS